MFCPVDKDRITDMFSGDAESIYQNTVSTINKFDMSDRIFKGVLLGFSGGADSVFLLCFLMEYRRRMGRDFNITAVHVNHLIRGNEALRDEEFCNEFANALRVDFISRQVDVPKLSEELKIGVEETARNVRYSIFDEIIQGRDCVSTVCLAHNASDNLETLIFNIMRGSGLSGVCGIPPVRDNIVRPLIHIAKTDIVNVLNTYGIPYVTDSSNNSIDYTRNYIRHEITPALSRLSISPEASVSRLTSSLIEDNAFISRIAAQEYNRIVLNGKTLRSDLLNLDVAILSRVLVMLIVNYSGASVTNKHISDIKKLLYNDNFSYSVGKGYSFVCQRGMCEVIADSSIISDVSEFILDYGVNNLEGYSTMVYVGNEEDNNFSNVYNFSIYTEIPFDIINGKLRLRFKKDGDSYTYNGITHKLKKVFNDRNIPPYQRNRIPIICDDSGILWVPGLPYRGYSKGNKNNLRTVRITIFYSTDNKGNGLYSASVRD